MTFPFYSNFFSSTQFHFTYAPSSFRHDILHWLFYWCFTSADEICETGKKRQVRIRNINEMWRYRLRPFESSYGWMRTNMKRISWRYIKALMASFVLPQGTEKKGEKRRMLKQLIVPCNWLRQKRGRKAIEMENLFWLLLFLFFINETEPSMKCFQTNLNRDCEFGCWFKQRKWMSRSLQIFSKLFLARKTKLGGIAFKQWRRTRHFARTFCWSALMSLSCLYGFLWLPFKKVNSIMSDDDDDD